MENRYYQNCEHFQETMSFHRLKDYFQIEFRKGKRGGGKVSTNTNQQSCKLNGSTQLAHVVHSSISRADTFPISLISRTFLVMLVVVSPWSNFTTEANSAHNINRLNLYPSTSSLPVTFPVHENSKRTSE